MCSSASCKLLVDYSPDQRQPAGGGAERRGEAGGDIDGAVGNAATAGGVRAALRLLRRGVIEHGAAADVRGAAAAPRRRVPSAADAAQPSRPSVQLW